MPPNAVGASPLRAGLDQVQEAQRPLPEPWRASEHAKRGEQTKAPIEWRRTMGPWRASSLRLNDGRERIVAGTSSFRAASGRRAALDDRPTRRGAKPNFGILYCFSTTVGNGGFQAFSPSENVPSPSARNGENTLVFRVISLVHVPGHGRISCRRKFTFHSSFSE